MGFRDGPGRRAGEGFAVTHDPDLPPDEVTWIRDWHDRAYAEGRSDVTRTFTYLDRTIVVPPDVQPVVGMAHVLGAPVLAEVQASDRVLDMGTGSGVNAVLAASVSTSVMAWTSILTPSPPRATTPS